MKTIDSNIKFSNPWWRYKVDNYELRNRTKSEYHYVETFGSTFVIPRLANGNFLLVKQDRYLINDTSIEFPGGGQKKELTKLENIKNELEEETGLIGNNFIELGVFNPYIGVTNELCSIYYCEEFTTSKQQLEETEIIELIELSESEIDNLIKENKMLSGISIVAWTFYKLNKGKL